MKGMDLARVFFEEWGLPYLQEHEPELCLRVAAGLFWGSEIFRGDDALSRGHNWGPTFLLVLTETDYAVHGRRLSEQINRAAPREWQGHRYQQLNPDKPPIRVASIDGYLYRRLQFSRPPEDHDEWLSGDPIQRELMLYALRHGELFYDPLGQFAERRRRLHDYPTEIWLARICDELHKVWHCGSNYCLRLLKRGDVLAMQLAVAGFSEAVMRLSLLLEKDYSPYWKWLAFESRKYPTGAALEPGLLALAATADSPERAGLILELSRQVGALLRRHGLAGDTEPGREDWLLAHLRSGPLAQVKKRPSLELLLGAPDPFDAVQSAKKRE